MKQLITIATLILSINANALQCLDGAECVTKTAGLIKTAIKGDVCLNLIKPAAASLKVSQTGLHAAVNQLEDCIEANKDQVKAQKAIDKAIKTANKYAK